MLIHITLLTSVIIHCNLVFVNELITDVWRMMEKAKMFSGQLRHLKTMISFSPVEVEDMVLEHFNVSGLDELNHSQYDEVVDYIYNAKDQISG